MSSRASWTERAFPDRLRRGFRRRFDGWLRRRGPVHPPLVLRYRQIFILPTGFGWMIAILLQGMLLGSLNYNNSLGLLTTFIVAGIGLLSMHLAFRTLEGLEVEAVHAEPVFAGQALQVRLQLRDRSGRARQGILTRRPPEPATESVDLAVDESVATRLRVPTYGRGRLELGRIRIATRQPLGLFEAWSWIQSDSAVRIWPRPADPVPPRPTSADLERSRHAGDESDEFHGLRDWREGDPLHRIAWKASQRHDRLLARQFMRPDRGRVVFRIDQAPAADLEGRLSVLCRWVLDAERDGIDYGLDLGTWAARPGRGEAHRNRCLDALADYE